jgi:uncharacterized membrane protein (UPF0136 family)
MKNLAIVTWVFGGLVILGGVIGYAKAKSKTSLISGLAFGVLLLLFGYAIAEGRRIGLQAGTGISLALAIIMGRRFLATKKFMPAGLVAILGVVVAVVLGMELFR